MAANFVTKVAGHITHQGGASARGSLGVWRRGFPAVTYGGDGGTRTPDLLSASEALSQLSYIPIYLIDSSNAVSGVSNHHTE